MNVAVIAPVAAGVTAEPAFMSAFAQHLEACGFESLVAVEHTVLMSRYTSVYPYDESGRVELPADCPVPIPLTCWPFSQARRPGWVWRPAFWYFPITIQWCSPSGSRRSTRCRGAAFGCVWAWAG